MSVNENGVLKRFRLWFLPGADRQERAGAGNRTHSSGMVSGVLSFCGLLCIAYASGWTAVQTLPQYAREPDTYGANRVYERKAVTSLLGEFRGTLAGFLYNRAHEYLHGGVLMRATTESEATQGVETNSEGEVCAIPDASRDHRGIWGDIERDTSPFTRVHVDRERTELLPMFRLMTWSDPHFIEGYNLGAYLVFSCSPDHRLERTLAFLEEGLAFNPDNYTLHAEYGYYQMDNARNVALAQQHFLIATRIIARMSSKQLDALDVQDHDEAQHAWEYLVLTYRKQGDRQQELYWAGWGLKCFSDSVVCRRSLRPKHAIAVSLLHPPQ